MKSWLIYGSTWLFFLLLIPNLAFAQLSKVLPVYIVNISTNRTLFEWNGTAWSNLDMQNYQILNSPSINRSFNETLTNLKYYLNTNPLNFITNTFNITYDAKPSNVFNASYEWFKNTTIFQMYNASYYLASNPSGYITNSFNATYDALNSANTSWTQSVTDALYMSINAETGNNTFNETLTNLKYYPLSNPDGFISNTFNSTYDAKPDNTYNITYDSKPDNTFNTTYDQKVSDNVTFNETLTNILYYLASNPSGFISSTYNNSYMTNTFNSTYDSKPSNNYNASYMTNTFNTTYDSKISYNSTFNETLTNGKYALLGSSGSTYNASYDQLVKLFNYRNDTTGGGGSSYTVAGNSYDYRYQIGEATTLQQPFGIKNTGTVLGDIYFVNSTNTSYLYCSNSGCNAGTVAVADVNGVLKSYAREDDSFRNTTAYDSNYKFVTHLYNTSALDVAGSNTVQTTGVIATDGNNTGKFGKALFMNSSTSNYRINVSTMNGGSPFTSYTIEFWFKTQLPATVQYLARGKSLDGSYGIEVSEASGSKFSCDHINSAGSWIIISSTTTIARDTWYYAVCEWNSTHLNLYLNGIKENSAVASGIKNAELGGNTFGSGTTSAQLFGTIDEIRVSNVARGVTYYQNQYWNGYGNLTTTGTEESQTPATSGDQFSINMYNVTINTTNLKGSGTGYVCVNANGQLFRSASACV